MIHKSQKTLQHTLLYLILGLIAVVSLTPYLWVVFASFKTNLEIFSYPFSLPESWKVDNYINAWIKGKFGVYYKNTIVVTIMSVCIFVPVVTMAAYAFVKMEFYGKKLFLFIVLFGLIIPFHSYMITLAITLRKIHLYDTYMAMVLPLVSLNIPFGIFYMRAFLQKFPSELLDAAKVDGCSELKSLLKIVLPISKSSIVSLSIFQTVLTWNAFMIPLLYIQRDSIRPITLGLMYFNGRYSVDYALTTSGAVLVSMPLIIIFLIFRRGFIRGLASGAIK